MKLIVVGSSNTDMVIKADRLPMPGETILGNEFFIAAGGKGANQAVAAARSGGEVTFIAKVGDDLFGRQAIDGFKKDGINTDHIFIDPETPSGVAQIIVDQKGENSIVVASGANMKLFPADIETCWQVFEGAEAVLMQLETPVATIEHIVKKLKNSGTKVILNPAPAAQLNDDCLDGLFLITPNETEAALLTGMNTDDDAGLLQAGQALRDKGVQNVIITLGSKGSLWISEAGQRLFESYKVKATDTTAAGDVFNGILTVGLAQGHSIPDAITYASAGAAISVTRNGAQDSAPTKTEIDAFLQSA